MPGMPSASGWVSGNAPLAISVVVTGAWAASASSRRASWAPALITPPPTYRTGRRASRSMAAASRTRLAWGRTGHQLVVLGHRDGDAGDVGLLERVRADVPARHLAGDRHQWHRVHVGVAEGRHQVGRAGAAGDHADPDPPGRPGVPLGGMAGALLVADQDVADRGVAQRVVGGEDGAPGEPEYDLDVASLQAADEGLRSGDLHCSTPVAGGADRSKGKKKTSCRTGIGGFARTRRWVRAR